MAHYTHSKLKIKLKIKRCDQFSMPFLYFFFFIQIVYIVTFQSFFYLFLLVLLFFSSCLVLNLTQFFKQMFLILYISHLVYLVLFLFFLYFSFNLILFYFLNCCFHYISVFFSMRTMGHHSTLNKRINLSGKSNQFCSIFVNFQP